MPRLALSDRTVRHLKAAEKQVQYWDAAFPSFGVRVNPKGTKTFNVMTGKDRRLIKIGRYPAWSLADARKRAAEIIDDQQPNRISYQAARVLFFERHLDTLKPTTAHEQKNLMRRFPFSIPLAAITIDDINRVVSDMPRGSARSCFNVFRTFLNWCVANDYLDRSPIRASPYKARTRDRLLTDHEIKLIWHESFNHGDFGRIVRCLILSGQRLNQFAALSPHHARVLDDTIVFSPALMKSNEQHTIPLSAELRRHLPQLQRPFTHLSGSMKRFRAALPGVPHFTCHDFRRYFSSTHANLRTPIDVTEALLDHRSGSRSQIQRIYDRHDRLPQMREALARYEAHLLNITGAQPTFSGP